MIAMPCGHDSSTFIVLSNQFRGYLAETLIMLSEGIQQRRAEKQPSCNTGIASSGSYSRDSKYSLSMKIIIKEFVSIFNAF